MPGSYALHDEDAIMLFGISGGMFVHQLNKKPDFSRRNGADELVFPQVFLQTSMRDHSAAMVLLK